MSLAARKIDDPYRGSWLPALRMSIPRLTFGDPYQGSWPGGHYVVDSRGDSGGDSDGDYGGNTDDMETTRSCRKERGGTN